MNKYSKDTFSNGLTLITIPLPVESVTAMVLIGAGSRYETADINGLSHFLEHMAFKGSKKRPSAQAISAEIDGIGGEFNAFTGKDHTGFYIKARKNHLPLLIDVLSDMILNPLLKSEDIEREKGVIIEEINMYEDTPMRHIGDVYESLLYGNTPLGWDTAGKAEIIKKIKRQHFVDYISKLYRPNNAILIVAGGVNQSSDISRQTSDVSKLIEANLGVWQEKKTLKFIKQVDVQQNPQVELQFKDTQQAHIALGVRAYSLRDPKRFAMSVMTAILGGGMSSRLFTEVREKRGLAYYVRCENSQYQDVGNFIVQSGVDVKRIDNAILVIKDQLFGLASQKYPITKQEIDKAKEYIKGTMTLEFEDSRSIAGFYGTQEILRREILTPDEIFQKIDQVTEDEIYKIAKEIFVSNHLNLAIIGPYKSETKYRQILNSKS